MKHYCYLVRLDVEEGGGHRIDEVLDGVLEPVFPSLTRARARAPVVEGFGVELELAQGTAAITEGRDTFVTALNFPDSLRYSLYINGHCGSSSAWY